MNKEQVFEMMYAVIQQKEGYNPNETQDVRQLVRETAKHFGILFAEELIETGMGTAERAVIKRTEEDVVNYIVTFAMLAAPDLGKEEILEVVLDPEETRTLSYLYEGHVAYTEKLIVLHDCGTDVGGDSPYANANGKSYGCAIFEISPHRPLEDGDDFDTDTWRDEVTSGDPIEVIYAPSDSGSFEEARHFCYRNNWHVLSA